MVSQNLQPWYGNSVVFESHSLMFHLTKKRYIRTDRVVLALSRVGQRNLYSEQYGNQANAACFHAVSRQYRVGDFWLSRFQVHYQFVLRDNLHVFQLCHLAIGRENGACTGRKIDRRTIMERQDLQFKPIPVLAGNALQSDQPGSAVVEIVSKQFSVRIK